MSLGATSAEFHFSNLNNNIFRIHKFKSEAVDYNCINYFTELSLKKLTVCKGVQYDLLVGGREKHHKK